MLILKLEKKNKQTLDSFKIQGTSPDPSKYLSSLSENSKFILAEELKEQGFLKQNEVARRNDRTTLRQSTLKRIEKNE